mgnify:CR=1 FL=1
MPKQTKLSVVPDAPILGINTSLYYQTPNWAAMKAIRAKLTGADWSVWAYLQMFDPFGDRLKDFPTPDEIAKTVGLSEKQVKRSLHKLEEMDFFEIKVMAMKGRNLTAPAIKKGRDKVVPLETKLSATGQSCPNRSSELPLHKESEPSQTIQTSSDSKDKKDSLSLDDELKQQLPEGERENFLIFAKEQAERLPTKPVLVDKWIVSCLPSLLSKYREEVWETKKAQVYEDSPRRVQNSNLTWDSLPGSVATDENVAERAAADGESLHPAIAEGLANGSIRQLDSQYDALWDANGRWWRCDEWIAEMQYQEERSSEDYQAEREKAKAAIKAMTERSKMDSSTKDAHPVRWLDRILQESSFWGDGSVLEKLNRFWQNSELRSHIQKAIDSGWCELVWMGDRISAIKEPSF